MRNSQMKRVLAVIAILLATDPAIAAIKVTKESMTLGGLERTYYQALPKEMREGEKLPLVLAFHGSGRNGESVVEKWTKLAQKERVIVVGLDSLDPQQWRIPEDGPNAVWELSEALGKQLPIDPARVYLFGHSAGAVFALELALIESEYFAAVAVHAGSFRSDGERAAIGMARRKPPVLIISGDRDAYFPPPSVAATVEAMRAAGIPAESFLMSGHDHWYYTLATSINERAWKFLAGQRLPGPPRYEIYATP